MAVTVPPSATRISPPSGGSRRPSQSTRTSRSPRTTGAVVTGTARRRQATTPVVMPTAATSPRKENT